MSYVVERQGTNKDPQIDPWEHVSVNPFKKICIDRAVKIATTSLYTRVRVRARKLGPKDADGISMWVALDPPVWESDQDLPQPKPRPTPAPCSAATVWQGQASMDHEDSIF